MQEVINTYKNHRGMSPDNAELAYILEASQLDSYGQETYPSKVKKKNTPSYPCLFVYQSFSQNGSQ